MANNTVKARIQLKNDTEAHWNLAENFIPLKGEIIIYSADDTHPFSRMKIGNGITNVINLPFISTETINGKAIKIGTTTEWNAQPNYIPNYGDIIIYTDKPGIKIGDGLAYCIDLPFINSDHINDITIHVTSEEKQKWNNKITCGNIVLDETLILTRD